MHAQMISLAVFAGLSCAQPVGLGTSDIELNVEYPEITAFRLLRSPGIEANYSHTDIGFGESISLDGERLYIGVPEWGPNASQGRRDSVGCVHVYDSLTGKLLNTLESPASMQFDYFGRQLTSAGGTVAIKAPQSTGASGLVLYDALLENQIGEISPQDPQNSVRFIPSRAFGDRVLVWYRTSSFNGFNDVSVHDLSTGAELHVFEVHDYSYLDFPLNDPFAFDDDVIVISDIPESSDSQPYGRLRVFESQSYDLLYTLEPLGLPELFGAAVAVNDSYIAYTNPIDPATNRLSIALVRKETGEPVWYFSPLDQGQLFGYSVAMNERFVCAASLFDEHAYLIKIDDPERVYRLNYRYEPNHDHTRSVEAVNIEMDERSLVISNGRNEAYLFRLDCPADLDGDSLVGAADVSMFLNAFASGDPLADLDRDGVFDIYDVSLYAEYAALDCIR